EFEVRVEALLAGLPAPAAARAELLAWARASIVELEAHLDEVEEFERRDRELMAEEALFDSGPSGAARLRAELAQDRVLRTSLQEVRRLQRERGEAADAGASDRAAGSADPAAPTEANLEAEVLSLTAKAAAPTEANLEAEVLSLTAKATAPTEANAEEVGPVTRVDIAAPTRLNPEAAIPCETVDVVAPSEADVEQEVLFVTAAAAASTEPDAGLEIARGGGHVFEIPVLGPTLWGLKGGGEAPAIRPDLVAPSEPNSGSHILFTMAG
ncbi:MAG: hypothetical protein JO329_22515, partial [Planctomycetaceae bacterium]|nr:hypothetical protein [Planctomycetaceae bacterium]